MKLPSFGRKKRAEAASPAPREPTAGQRTPTLRQVHHLRADATLRGSELIYAAVSRISSTMASLPMHLYKGWEIQINHPLEQVVCRQPNPNFTRFSFVQTMEALRNTEGNAYALIVPDALGATRRLDILDPSYVTPALHPETGEIWYYVTLDGTRKPIPGSSVIALKHMSGNGLKGIRPIDVLRGSLDFDRQTKELSLDQLDGVNHGIMLTVPNTGLGPDERARVVQDFFEAYDQSDRKVVVLEGGLQATTFKQDAVDSQLLDVEKITRGRVATVYMIPPHMLGDYSAAKPSTMEQQMMEYLTLTIMPIVAQWEAELNRKLLTPADLRAGYTFRFDMDEVARADLNSRANANQIAIRGGFKKPNEVRASEGLPPDPNGDRLMTSRDLIPLEIAVQHPEMLLGAAGASSGEGRNEA